MEVEAAMEMRHLAGGDSETRPVCTEFALFMFEIYMGLHHV
jgi:hypothetical protein